MSQRPGAVFAKYLVLQVPGWFGVGTILAAAVHWWDLGTPLALGLFAAWFLKDLLLFPVLRRAYETDATSPADALVGSLAIVSRTLEVESGGTVQLGPELWRARARSPHAPVPAGATVRVFAVRGLMLVVEPAPDRDGQESGQRGEGI